MTPIDFARRPASAHETCAGFAVRWIEAMGVASNLPTTADILQAWRDKGVLGGAQEWFTRRIGLEPSDPAPNCIAVVEQDGGGALVGVIDSSGLFVTRAFGEMKVTRAPRIIAAWRLPYV